MQQDKNECGSSGRASEARRVSLIVAVSENGVIGNRGQLPWRLSSDLRRFKQLTMGHAIIMGRKTYESIGRLLPGRDTVIVTRNRQYRVAGAAVVHSLQEAVRATSSDSEPFIIGGAELYRQSIAIVDRIYRTRVLADVEGDAFFPSIDRDDWKLVEQITVPADDRNEFDHVFEVLDRIRVSTHPVG